jgi:hypothetical protein
MTFGNLLQAIDQRGLELRVQGFFNIESGGFGITNAYYPECECVTSITGDENCQSCERWFANYTSFFSGDGDGIYVAAAIINPAEPDRTLGLLTVFDYKFQMAAYARQIIEDEGVPDFPLDLALQFEDSLAYKLGGLVVKDTLLIGDKHLAQNSNYAVVDFSNPVSGGYKCLIYCEEVDPAADATITRLIETQGLDPLDAEQSIIAGEAIFESVREIFGFPEGASPRPSYIARAAVALSDELKDLLEADEFEFENWELAKSQYELGAVTTANKHMMTQSVIWQNAMLAREWDRAAGDIDNDTAKRLLFDLFTWLYQGRELGSEDCANYLKNFKYQPTTEEQIYLLVRRGMFEAASRIK